MPESDQIAKNKVSYSGVLDIKEFYEMLNSVYSELKYEIDEIDHKVKHTSKGMLYAFIWENTKNVDDYTRFKIWMKVYAENLQPVQADVDGKKKELHEGEVQIIFKSFVITDYGGKWEGNPYLVFLKGFFDKYLYGRQGTPYLAKGVYADWIDKCLKDQADIIKEVKAFLHLYK